MCDKVIGNYLSMWCSVAGKQYAWAADEILMNPELKYVPLLPYDLMTLDVCF